MPTQNFTEPRENIPLPKSVAELFAARMHRLHHALWHGLRDSWESLSDGTKKEITALKWNPPRTNQKFYKNGWMPRTTNGSGIDFLFMHREMIREFDEAMTQAGGDPNIGWEVIPEPGRFKDFDVPGTWELPEEIKWLERRFKVVKSDEFYWSRMKWWDRQFHNHEFLSKVTLGELGSLIETSVHNDMHMRWASQPFDPATGEPTALGRAGTDIDPKWDVVVYDFLGETYSSHVNPIFWRLHKWVDSIIDEWQAAHINISSDRVKIKVIDNIKWFEKGNWVEVDNPWSSPYPHAHHDIPTMEKVYKILFAPDSFKFTQTEDEAPATWF
jgi:hypothetical protein